MVLTDAFQLIDLFLVQISEIPLILMAFSCIFLAFAPLFDHLYSIDIFFHVKVWVRTTIGIGEYVFDLVIAGNEFAITQPTDGTLSTFSTCCEPSDEF